MYVLAVCTAGFVFASKHVHDRSVGGVVRASTTCEETEGGHFARVCFVFCVIFSGEGSLIMYIV